MVHISIFLDGIHVNQSWKWMFTLPSSWVEQLIPPEPHTLHYLWCTLSILVFYGHIPNAVTGSLDWKSISRSPRQKRQCWPKQTMPEYRRRSSHKTLGRRFLAVKNGRVAVYRSDSEGDGVGSWMNELRSFGAGVAFTSEAELPFWSTICPAPAHLVPLLLHLMGFPRHLLHCPQHRTQTWTELACSTLVTESKRHSIKDEGPPRQVL